MTDNDPIILPPTDHGIENPEADEEAATNAAVLRVAVDKPKVEYADLSGYLPALIAQVQREDLAAHKDETLDDRMKRWLADTATMEAQLASIQRTSNIRRLLVAVALRAEHRGLDRGTIGLWEKRVCERLGLKPRMVAYYISLGVEWEQFTEKVKQTLAMKKYAKGVPATELQNRPELCVPVTVLDRPFVQVEAAIRDWRNGRNPDAADDNAGLAAGIENRGKAKARKNRLDKYKAQDTYSAFLDPIDDLVKLAREHRAKDVENVLTYMLVRVAYRLAEMRKLKAMTPEGREAALKAKEHQRYRDWQSGQEALMRARIKAADGDPGIPIRVDFTLMSKDERQAMAEHWDVPLEDMDPKAAADAINAGGKA